jgi:hypothetical protein
VHVHVRLARCGAIERFEQACPSWLGSAATEAVGPEGERLRDFRVLSGLGSKPYDLPQGAARFPDQLAQERQHGWSSSTARHSVSLTRLLQKAKEDALHSNQPTLSR